MCVGFFLVVPSARVESSSVCLIRRAVESLATQSVNLLSCVCIFNKSLLVFLPLLLRTHSLFGICVRLLLLI